MVRIIITLFVFLLLSERGAAQRFDIDSLKAALETYPEDTNQVKTLNILAWELKFREPEEAIAYAKKSIALAKRSEYRRGQVLAHDRLGIIYDIAGEFEKAEEQIKAAMEAAIPLEDKSLKASLAMHAGIAYMRQRNYEQALRFLEKSLTFKKEIGDKRALTSVYNNIGAVYHRMGWHEKAIENYFQSLKIKEELGDMLGVGVAYRNIGAIHEQQDDYEKALDYHRKSLAIFEGTDNTFRKAESMIPLMNTHRNLGNYDSALWYSQRGEELYKELNNFDRLYAIYNSTADIYREKGQLIQALTFFEKARRLEAGNERPGDRLEHHYKLARLLIAQDRYEEARTNLRQALGYAQQIREVRKIQAINDLLHEVEAQLGDYEAAYQALIAAYNAQDSLFDENRTKLVSQLDIRYQTAKKEKEIDLLSEQQKLQEEKIQQQNAFIIAAVSGLVILSLLSILLVRANRLRKQANEKLRTQKAEIQEQAEELRQLNEETRQQSENLQLANAQIQKKNDDITASINYAERIQAAMLPSWSFVQEFLPESFVLFKPRDIVSGDFYWFSQENDTLVLAAVDCTGHGVPGAFMSMTGDALLNQIVNLQGITEPGEILTRLHQEVRRSLRQQETKNPDGMDMTLCRIDLENRLLDVAGAKNPVVIIREGGELEVIKGDKFPIGGEERGVERHFQTHHLSLEETTNLYLFSDGFQDQFGGPKGRKFMRKRFYRLLQEIHHLPAEVQRDRLAHTLRDWRKGGKHPQVDDILVLGVRL